jgi:lysophospholipase L1-like esterase
MKIKFISLVVAFFLAILATLAFLFISDKNSQTPQVKFEKTTHAHYLRKARSINQESIVFLGSSSIQALNVSQVTPNGMNFGIGGERISGLIHRVEDYYKLPLARLVVFGAGFNDLCRSSIEKISMDFDYLLDTVTNKNIIISGMQPATNKNLCVGLPDRIYLYNQYLKDKCDSIKKCYYVDLNKVLSLQKSQVFERDGIHLNELGYRVWQAELTRVIEQAINIKGHL